MEEILVIIQSDGLTAKEVNPFKEEVDKHFTLGHDLSFNLIESYGASEATLRVFQINDFRPNEINLLPASVDPYVTLLSKFKSGSIYKGKVLPNGKIDIIEESATSI